MNKIMFFANATLFLFGLAECPIKPVDTSKNGLEKDWKNVGMDIQKAMSNYEQAE